MIEVVTITGPLQEPVTTAEAKQNSNVFFQSDDALIASLISAAREVVEYRSGFKLYSQTIEIRADSFDEAEFVGNAHRTRNRNYERKDVINLRVGKVTAVSSLKYYNSDDTDTTMPASDYWTDLTGSPARIQVKDSWPSTNDRIGNVRIRCTAGWASVAEIPENFKAAIKILVSHWYENREAVTDLKLMPIPEGIDTLIHGTQYHHFRTGAL